MERMQDFIKPPDGSLFEPVEGPRGLRLALVFGNEAPEGKCPFYKVQCTHCDLGEGEGIRFCHEKNRMRLDFFRNHFGSVLQQVEHLIIYNSGSTLNPVEMSHQTLSNILAFARNLKNARRISFDSREPFITAGNIARILDGLRCDQNLAVTVGFESQNDRIRIDHLGKKITKEQLNTVFSVLSGFSSRTGVELNVLFQPPDLLGNDAVKEAVATVEFGLSVARSFDVPVDFNFHPYYPSWKGSMAFPNHPKAILEDVIRALIIIIREIKTGGHDSKVFIGWNDEGHDLQPAVHQRELFLYAPGLARFNVSQDEKDLII